MEVVVVGVVVVVGAENTTKFGELINLKNVQYCFGNILLCVGFC